METSLPKQNLGFGVAPQAGQGSRHCPAISLAWLAVLLMKLPPSQQRKNVIQQDGENCQQKILIAPASHARLPSKSKGPGISVTSVLKPF
jgi:hypothetical protein